MQIKKENTVKLHMFESNNIQTFFSDIHQISIMSNLKFSTLKIPANSWATSSKDKKKYN